MMFLNSLLLYYQVRLYLRRYILSSMSFRQMSNKIPCHRLSVFVLILNILKIGVITFDKGILYMGVILLIESILFATLLVYIRIKHYGSFHKWSYDKKLSLVS